jgi:hypothetical protein
MATCRWTTGPTRARRGSFRPAIRSRRRTRAGPASRISGPPATRAARYRSGITSCSTAARALSAINNTVGALKEGKGNGWDGTPADGDRVRNVVKSLPYTDVQFGTSSSGNTDFNGWRDHVDYLNALRPRIFLPGHAPVGATLQYYSGFLATLKLMEQPRGSWPGFPSSEWPALRWLVDPTDTLKPMVFDVHDQAWDRRGKAQRIAEFCGGHKGHGDRDD